MKYKEIRTALNLAGFNIEYIQTDTELDMLMFEHETIAGGINLSFGNVDISSLNLEDGIDYNSDVLDDFDVSEISFDIDVSISFFSKKLIDICGNSDINQVTLSGDEIDINFYTILGVVTDPNKFIDFVIEYNNKYNEFLNSIRRFIPILEKYDFKVWCNYTENGDKTTICNNREMMFINREKSITAYFLFNPLTKNEISVISYNECEDLNFHCELTEFEKVIIKML